ncbi:SDR family oxidoreductase [Bacillus sp. Marseille-Q3570]|uniref:SDR family oxidoreductase n=1 Tax=Bacillus sp. Marseille-Q3570 TaxID=2963522 RepID=UPI0021B7CAAE|nr:SDR family oxidoreductase [Bacillus sp. Marseille-Q3570]
MSNVYFFTGFPGFLATKLIEELSIQDPDASFLLLVHDSQLEKAMARIEKLENQERYSILSGDITQEGLGLEDTLCGRDITHVFHLAAIYDLAVPQSVAQLVNVSGTRRVLEWLSTLSNLKRFVYFSTAYVSGTRTGTVYEHELNKKQSFKNHYESTKFEAEVLVQEQMAKIPTTIIRPGIVVGIRRLERRSNLMALISSCDSSINLRNSRFHTSGEVMCPSAWFQLIISSKLSAF